MDEKPKVEFVNDRPVSQPEFLRNILIPLSRRGWPKWLVYLLGLLGVVYMLNPTAGFIELIPDNLPIVGNLDEGLALMLVIAGLVEFFDGKGNKGQ